MAWSVSILLLLLSMFSGCAGWEKPKPEVDVVKFSPSQLSLDSVGLEIGLVQLDDSQTATIEAFWKILDAQKLPLATRQRLDQNGLRVGILSTYIPAIFQELTAPRPIELEELDTVEQHLAERDLLKPKSRMLVHQRITNHDGEAHPVQTSELRPQLSWVILNEDRQTVGSGNHVRGLFEVTTIPLGDGSVRLRFVPQIHHGEMQPTIGVAERAFCFDASQTIVNVDELSFDVSVRLGETVVIGPTADVQDLGALFFANDHRAADAHRRLTHRMLLIRVVQTQLDDLFGNSVATEKLTTTSYR